MSDMERKAEAMQEGRKKHLTSTGNVTSSEQTVSN